MKNLHGQIEDYLLGELEGQDLQDFENTLQSDAALANALAQHREMTRRLDALRLRKKVAAAISPHRSPKSSLFAKPLFWAAVLALLTAAVWLFHRPAPAHSPAPALENPQQNTPPDIAIEQEKADAPETPAPPMQSVEKPLAKNSRALALAQDFHVGASQSLIRDTEAAAESPLQKAAEAYERKNYPLALKHLQGAEADENAQFLRASALFRLGNYAQAAQVYEALKNSFQYQHEARWNALLCQLAQGKTAQQELEEMARDEDYPFQNKALDLQGKLNF